MGVPSPGDHLAANNVCSELIWPWKSADGKFMSDTVDG